MSIKRWRKAREILTIWSFWLTIEKVGSGSDTMRVVKIAMGTLSPYLISRLIALYTEWWAVRTLQLYKVELSLQG